MLFTVPAFGGHEERQERKRTIGERTEYVASLTNHSRQAVVWCHTNDEADRLVDAIDGAEQVAGTTSDEERERIYDEFATGSLRVLVIKPKIGAWGMNWQNCNHVVTYASHSYEQYYQSVRRCWRFGQKRPVQLDVVATEGEIRVLGNMRAKGKRADDMFAKLVEQMNEAVRIERQDIYTKKLELPKWA
jgi:superfamily II DNA/RNA helicase